MRAAYDYLFTTGGIGPTHDDITIDAIAQALGVAVVVHPEARRILEDYYAPRGMEMTESRLRMARVPEGAELIANPSSGAPGVKWGNIYILAGVPHIAASMLEALTGKLEGGRPVVSVTVGARAPESEVAELLQRLEKANAGFRSAAIRSSVMAAMGRTSWFGRKTGSWRGGRSRRAGAGIARGWV